MSKRKVRSTRGASQLLQRVTCKERQLRDNYVPTPSRSGTSLEERLAMSSNQFESNERLSLVDSDRKRLVAEEIFRTEVRQSLQPSMTRSQRVLSFLNSNLGLWLLSALFVTGLSTAYSAWSTRATAKRVAEESLRRLDFEIEHRMECLSVLDDGIITFTQLETAKGALSGTNAARADVGDLGEFMPIFIEFKGRSLFSLIWEQQKLVPVSEQAALEIPLEQVRNLASAFDWMVMHAPVGDEDSKWRVQPEKESELKNMLSRILAKRWVRKAQLLDFAQTPATSSTSISTATR